MGEFKSAAEAWYSKYLVNSSTTHKIDVTVVTVVILDALSTAWLGTCDISYIEIWNAELISVFLSDVAVSCSYALSIP